MYVIGKSGMGKSTMLENMAIQDIQNGEGMIFIDPHGSTAEKLLDFVPQERVKDMLYLAPFDTENPIGFNILEDVGYDNRHKVVAGLMGVFERIWADSWSARMQYILQNTLFALLEYPGATIIDVNRMLVNKAFRAEVVKHITDPVVNAFWNEEFANYGDRYTQEATPAIQNKIGQFVSNPLIRNILGQSKSTLTMNDDEEEKNKDDDWWRPAMFFYIKVTSWIVIPILVAFLLKRFALGGMMSQIGFFVLIAIGFLISCFGIYREINIYKDEVNNQTDK
jgi:hypothetical protein